MRGAVLGAAVVLALVVAVAGVADARALGPGAAVAAGAGAAGPPVRVGVIDSGVGAADPSGHGSAVAAVLRDAAAARGVPLRLQPFPDVNRAGVGQPRLMAGSIRRAAASQIRVVNISQTIPGRAGRVRRALAAAPDTLFVVAAGNEGLDLAEPGLDRDPCSAPLRNVVCVGELGPGGRRAASSNFGAGVVDAWAPGPDGTSFAAPRVAAHAAALLRRHPEWGVARVRSYLVRDTDPEDERSAADPR